MGFRLLVLIANRATISLPTSMNMVLFDLNEDDFTGPLDEIISLHPLYFIPNQRGE